MSLGEHFTGIGNRKGEGKRERQQAKNDDDDDKNDQVPLLDDGGVD